MNMSEHLHEFAIEPRNSEEKMKMMNRLKRIEGQVRGIQKMVDEDRYCIDILVQISAIQSALKNVGYSVTERHRSEEHTSELQSRGHLVCRLMLEKKKHKE